MVPVWAGEEDLGVLVLDAFQPGRYYGAADLATATLYGVLIGLGLAAADQAERLEEFRERLAEHNRLLEEESGAEADAARAMDRAVSRSMRRVLQMARQVAVTDAPVLIGGETGTGKEVLARAIHAWSHRAALPFVTLHCAALPRDLIESELFGHTRGAFSGAVSDRQGRFRVADGGTLLLDEVGDLPEETQVKLLRVLQEGTFRPVGSDRTVSIDVRVIAATHVDLEAAIEEGRFREDLYYRLNVFPLRVPALRERLEDLPSLSESILEGIRRRTGQGPWTLSPRVLARMRRYDWPGNVRELVNVLERARVLKPEGGALEIETARAKRSSRRRSRPETPESPWPTLAENERDYLLALLERSGGKIYGEDGAARAAGMPPSTLQSRLKKHGIERTRRGRRRPSRKARDSG
jgi:transcriptional regulator with GAF, ATPase, and Fis domain